MSNEVEEVTASVFRATVAALSNSINQYLQRSVPNTVLRALYLLCAVSGVAWWRPDPNHHMLTFKTFRGIVVSVISFAVVSFVASECSPKGADTLTLSLVTTVVLLTVVQPVCAILAQGRDVPQVVDSLAANAQYVFTNTLAVLMTNTGKPVVSVVVALTLAGLEHISFVKDPVLHTAIIGASVMVVKGAMLATIPAVLTIPAHVLILCFVHPLIQRPGMKMVYEFVLYTSGQAVAEVIQREFTPWVAALLATVIALLVRTSALQALARVTATVLLTDITLLNMHSAAEADPILTLLLAGMATQLVITLVSNHKP